MKYKTKEEKTKFIKSLRGKINDTDLRKKIGEIFKVGKSQRNEIFNQIFNKQTDDFFTTVEAGVRNIVKDIAEEKIKSKVKNFETNGDNGVAEVKGVAGVKTLEDLIQYCNIDLSIWEPVKFWSNVWADKLQVKAEFKRKVSKDTKKILEELKEDLINYSPVVNKYNYLPSIDSKLLVISVMDAHLGKLSSPSEVNHAYDLKIAREIYLNTLNDLIIKAKKQGNIEKILYIVGNDYLTIDNLQNTTTAGTPQEVDSRFPKIFREGRKLLVETIDILTQIAPVDVVVVLGNHDRSSMFHLGDALQCWFRNNKNVNIDNQEKIRKYYSYKDVVFGMTHGDTIKHDKLVTMGLVELGEQWGKAKRRFWFLGHTHHLKCINLQGTELWTFPSISGSDNFHQANGYVGTTRNGLAMIFSKDNLEAVFQSQPVEDKDYR
jgi:hypothetical protein